MKIIYGLMVNANINFDVFGTIRDLNSNKNLLGLIPHPLRDSFLEEVEACKKVKKRFDLNN